MLAEVGNVEVGGVMGVAWEGVFLYTICVYIMYIFVYTNYKQKRLCF